MSKIGVTIDGRSFEVEVRPPQGSDGELSVVVNGQSLPVSVPGLVSPETMDWIIVGGRPYEIIMDGDLRWLQWSGGRHSLEVRDLEAVTTRPVSGDARVKAPVPGLVTRILVTQGQRVEAGEPIMVLEAMKMENEITAPRSGTVSRLDVSLGQGVMLSQVLAEIA